MAGMHMGVDESRRDQLVAGVDLAVDGALEALADEQHGVAFVDQLGIAPERMMSVGMPTSQPQVMRVRMKSLPVPGHSVH